MKRNHLYILLFSVFAMLSCEDHKMDWYNPHEGNEITASQLPLALAEQISRYDAIKSYIPRQDFVIGLGMGMDLYVNNSEYRALVNANYNSVTLGNAMKQSSIMNAKGEMDFSKVDAFLELLPQDMALYGHNLLWHTQQAATYLNGLIAPEYVPGESSDGNVLDVSALKEGRFGNWNPQNTGAGITVESGAGAGGGYAVKLVGKSTGSNPWDLQLITPDIPYVSGHSYRLSFLVRSEGNAKGRVSFQNLSNNYPWLNWLGTGNSEAFEFGTSWTQITVDLPAAAEGKTSFKCQFDFGYTADAVIYLDVNTLKVIDLDAPAETNFVTNGSFENDANGWTLQNKGAGMEVITSSDAIEGRKVLKMTSSASSSKAWDLQLITSDIPAEADKTYKLSFYIKADSQGKGRVSFQNLSSNYPWMDWLGTGGSSEAFSVPVNWTLVEVTLPAIASGQSAFKCQFDFGYLPDVTYYLDNVKVTAVGADGSVSTGSAGGFVEKTDEQKKEILTAALESWIKGMVNHYKHRVHAWDVLNEAIDDGGKLRGVEVMPAESDMDNDDFYWGKYLGKDYAVKAFQWAREADPSATLFINDYNLEYSAHKLDKLIEYVKYIEQQGARVDGIGTQMHIDIRIDRENITRMFRTLAATDKLIRITELDIKVNTSSPTAENLAAQADLYRFVIEQYKAIIPESRQAGVTLWTLSDHPDEHVYWIPNDAPNLFDANYRRKHAYKGVCDALAGKDIGAEFSGELQY